MRMYFIPHFFSILLVFVGLVVQWKGQLWQADVALRAVPRLRLGHRAFVV